MEIEDEEVNLKTVRVRVPVTRDVYYKIQVKDPKNLDEVKEKLRKGDAANWESDPDFYEHLGDSFWECVGEIEADNVEELPCL